MLPLSTPYQDSKIKSHIIAPLRNTLSSHMKSISCICRLLKYSFASADVDVPRPVVEKESWGRGEWVLVCRLCDAVMKVR